MAQETELKLVIDPADAHRLPAMLGRAPERTMQFATRYFDTADGALASAGISLRIREAGGTRTQTVKQSAPESAGLLRRGEWERSVDGEVPLLDGDDPASALLASRAVALETRFTLAITRQLWRIEQDGSLIELVLDEGSVTAGESHVAVCEIEAELLTGKTAALFDLVGRIGASAPVRLGLWSKAQTGERLRAGLSARSAKAGKAPLAPVLVPLEALEAALAAGVRHYRMNEDVLLAGHDANAVHQARVAIRRLRATLALFAPLIRPAVRRALNQRLRLLGQALGPVRERDVLLAGLPAPARRAARKARDADFAQVRALLDRPEVRALPLDLLALAHMPGSTRKAGRRMSLNACLGAGLARLEKRLMREAGPLAAMPSEQRHTLRKRAKALRYALEIAAGPIDAAGGRAARRQAVDHLAAMQEALGTLNDSHERPALLARLGLPDQALPQVDEAPLLAQAQAALDALPGLLPLLPSSARE